MKRGARCKHCGNYRVFMIDDDTGEIVRSILCQAPGRDACEPESIAEQVARQNATAIGDRVMGRRAGKSRTR